MKKFDKPHIKNGRFCHDLQHRSAGFFLSSILMMLKSIWLRWTVKRDGIENFICVREFQDKKINLNNQSILSNNSGNKEFGHNQAINSNNQEINSTYCNPVVTWIGHATFLIQVGGANILTDPVLGQAAILYRLLYKRCFQPGIPQDKLPNIDFVLISHNHMDHMDAQSLIYLKSHKNTNFLVPKGNKKWFEKRGFAADRVREYGWWESDIFLDLKFTFLPASHWSQRGVFDKNKTLWGSWIIEQNYQENNNKNIYTINNCDLDSANKKACEHNYKIFFAGDTGYDTHFSEIAQEFKDINVALMPIGPCEPRKWVAHHHVDAREAVQAFFDLNAKHFVPMHWGTFPLGAEVFDLPINKLQEYWLDFHNSGLLSENQKLHLPKVGEQLEFSYPVSEPDSLYISDFTNLQEHAVEKSQELF